MKFILLALLLCGCSTHKHGYLPVGKLSGVKKEDVYMKHGIPITDPLDSNIAFYSENTEKGIKTYGKWVRVHFKNSVVVSVKKGNIENKLKLHKHQKTVVKKSSWFKELFDHVGSVKN